jgi:hypothetical protein
MFKHFGLDVEPDKMIQYSRLTPTFWAVLSDDALFRVPDSSEPSEIATGEKRNGSGEQHASSTQATEPISFAKHEREGLPSRAHIMDDLLLELQQPITITESGKSRRISKQQALLLAILQQVTRGKRYAWKLFWSMFTHFALDQEPDIYLQAFRDDPDSPTLQEELEREQW